MARRVRGNVRQLLKRMPDAIHQEFREELENTGKIVLARQRARAPVRVSGDYSGGRRVPPGGLRAGLSYRLLPKTLKLKVGLVGKPINRKLFYGRIIEFGRKAKTVIVNRSGQGVKVSGNRWKRQALKAGVKGFYRLRVRAMAPHPFIFNMTRDQLYRPFQKIWGRAIYRASKGAFND